MSVVPPLASASSWDRALRGRLLAGEPGALGELYDQYASFVFGLAARVTNDRRAAEDVAQEVFVSVWQHPDAFDPDRGSLRSWLGTLAHRRAVDHVRREEANRRRAARQAAVALGPPPDIEEVATAMAVAERVREAIDALPAEQGDAVRLAYFGGRSYRQVATELGIPEGTAKSRLRLGLRRLADTLRREGLESWQ
jgi:RNA polymerase sigma-70 factor (ECF subfamily)